MKKTLESLEGEKRANNFGKYEREKMKSELDSVQQERSKMTTKIEALTKECSSLKAKIEEMSKGGEKTKQELHQKNSSLLSQVTLSHICIWRAFHSVFFFFHINPDWFPPESLLS